MNVRTITLFSTKGKKKAKIETDVATWGELQPLVRNQGYDLDHLHATESVNRHDLNHDTGTLHQGDFTIFLRPKKTKSGLDVEGLSFKELRAIVKDNIDNEDFKAHINSEGNYTRIKTEDLRALLKKWNGSSSKGTSSEKEAPSTAKEHNAIESITNSQRLDTISNILDEIKSNSDSSEVSDRVDLVYDEIVGLRIVVEDEDSGESEEEKEAREAQEAQDKADKEETEKLAKEAEELGF